MYLTPLVVRFQVFHVFTKSCFNLFISCEKESILEIYLENRGPLQIFKQVIPTENKVFGENPSLKPTVVVM